MIIRIQPVINQTFTIKRIVEEALPPSWDTLFQYALPELKHISKKLDDENVLGPYWPLKCNLFSAFTYTRLNNVKVILLDHEPLNQLITINEITQPRDTGMAYSLHPQDQLTPALQMMYKELQRTFKQFINPHHGDLRNWAR